MSIKVLAGDWDAGTRCAFNPAIFGRPDRLAVVWPFGVEYTAKEIASIEIVTERNQTSIMGKVGWGALGGIALGPLGLLACVLGGGNRHLKIVALELVNGKRALIQCDAKSYAEIMRLGFKGRSERPAQDIPTTRQLSGPPRKPPGLRAARNRSTHGKRSCPRLHAACENRDSGAKTMRMRLVALSLAGVLAACTATVSPVAQISEGYDAIEFTRVLHKGNCSSTRPGTHQDALIQREEARGRRIGCDLEAARASWLEQPVP